ncbi:hypothetical protein [Lactiplantibacillus plantarum]|uniref:hypothetical protein n=1 Tax=Lactiplantibacillus plantarum TaxID=1590 RepID=UPI0020C169D7|nr:hypothetical protein [Lactiplantibacillus plantarum]MCK8474055.1 hypothetical protein [Lactiplantibacillus plantarum]
MAESNATQVILTDDGIKIIKAQNTADNAASQASNADSAALIAQSMANLAKSAADSNYNYANSEIAVQSQATVKAQSTADNAFSQAQEVSSQASAEISNNSQATAKAQSTADNAFSQAQAVGSQASAEISNNSQATAKAQSTADNAFNQATSAIDNGKVTSQAVINLKNGSKLTIADLENGLATKVADSEYASYKLQTASQIAQKVDNGTFSAYQTTTADLIADKVATKDFSAYQATTAKAIDSKVESSAFNTYKTQTADMIASKVSSTDFNNMKISGRNFYISSKDFSNVQGNVITPDSSKDSNGVTTIHWTGNNHGAGIFTRHDNIYQNNISPFNVGDTISFSFDAKGSGNLKISYEGNFATNIKLTNDWQRYSLTGKVSSKSNAFTIYDTDNNPVEAFIRLPKVELGNPTPYSQAPEDLANQSQITQLSGMIDSKVSNSAYASDKLQTASQIASKVDNGDFQTYQTQTGKLIESKVDNGTYQTDKTQTAKDISSKVSSSDFQTYQTQTAKLIDDKVSNSAYSSDKLQTASQISDRVSNSAFSTYKTQTASQIAQKVDSGAFSAYQTTTADLIAQKVATSDFSAYQATTAKEISSKVESNDFESYQTQTDSVISGKVSSKDFEAETKLLSDDINLRVTKGDLIDEINLQAGNTLISSSGQLTLSADTIFFDTKKPVIIPNANIADTLNGKTFHGGDVISNANNTAKYYPMTITPDGAYKSTYFDSAVGLQSSVESGAISYKYRSMIGNGTYLYDNVAIDGQGITLDSGTTTTKDTTFSAAETEAAYISLTTEAGLYLHGSNANIDFGGHLSDDSTSVGMYMNPYGNLIAKSASQYWQISVAGTDNTGGGPVARFGIDSASAYNIIFNRELDIGNFKINTGHTFTSADKGAIHFAKGGGGAADIYAGAVHYTSLVKSSLLSVKKDVKKADTAYWAQLVNSIDLATYQYKTDDNTSHIRLSSIVDDVNDTKQWQLPDVFISRDENGKLSGVDDSVLLNATLATVQQQQKEIDQLNGHNMELEARLNKLEAKLNG